MMVDKIKEKIAEAIKSDNTASIYFVLRQGDEYKIRFADIESEKAGSTLNSMFINRIRETILNNDDLSICNISVADERTNAIFMYDYDEYPEELSIIKNFNITDIIKKIQSFDFKSDELKDLCGYIIYIGSMNNGIVLYKKHYNISLIKRDSFLLGMFKDRNRFEMVSGEDILRLNSDFHFIKVDDNIFVLDIAVLERNMGFTRLVVKAAEEAIVEIEKIGLVEDPEVLIDSIDDISFARKLSKVNKSSPIFKLGISKEQVLDFTKNTPELKGIFKYSDDNKFIRLNTKKSKQAFVKLLNDAYLKSELTKIYYEARAKDNIVPENDNI